MPDQKSCKVLEFNLPKDILFAGHRMTAVVTCDSSRDISNSFTLMASFGESASIIGFHLLDSKMEHKQSLQVQREGNLNLIQDFEVFEIVLLDRAMYNLAIAASTCDKLHLLLISHQSIYPLQISHKVFDGILVLTLGVIRGVLTFSDKDIIVYGKAKDSKGFLKRIVIS